MLKIGMCIGVLSLSLASGKLFTGEPFQMEAKEKVEKTKYVNHAPHFKSDYIFKTNCCKKLKNS